MLQYTEFNINLYVLTNLHFSESFFNRCRNAYSKNGYLLFEQFLFGRHVIYSMLEGW